MSDWISVKDRLPERGIEVLCVWLSPYTGNYMFIVDEAYDDGFMSDNAAFSDVVISHWRPLPEPPETAEKGQRHE